jgi:hypothetical protein
VAPPAPTESGAGPDSPTPPGDFYTCHADQECIAVRKVGCCNHGEKEAVNASSAAAYAASFTCNERPICAHFMRRDLRVARCNQGSQRCEMVAAPPP